MDPIIGKLAYKVFQLKTIGCGFIIFTESAGNKFIR